MLVSARCGEIGAVTVTMARSYQSAAGYGRSGTVGEERFATEILEEARSLHLMFWRIIATMIWRSKVVPILALGIVWALGAASSGASRSDSKVDPVLGERIAGGIAFAGRLWLRGTMAKNPSGDDSGGLVSVALQDQSRHVEFDQGVYDARKFDGKLWVLRRLTPKEPEFVVSFSEGNGFQDLAKFQATNRDVPIALLNSAGFPVVLSERTLRVFAPDTRSWHVVEMKGEHLRLGVQVSIASPDNGGSTYIGFNRGEWGGGLQQVSLQTGTVSNVERRDTKRPCDGPLNSDCDPVTGVISDPSNKNCVVVSVGLVHLFTSKGRILRVCDQQVNVITEVPLRDSSDKYVKQTEAFYGLKPAADGGFWAITWRALYHYTATAERDGEYPLPKLQPVSGIYISRDIPGTIILKTDVNWAVSTSGYTPLVVPLDSAKH